MLASAQYAETFAARRVLRGVCFVLHYRRNHLPSARLGLVIPKKQARTAVLRNAVKRQARELFRQVRGQIPAVDLVLRLSQPLNKPHQPGFARKREIRAGWRAEMTSLFAQLADPLRS